MAEKRMNIGDIAALAGVSKSTVSNYLNGRFESMADETRDRLADIIRTHDYAPDLSARRLSGKGKARTVCLIVPHDIGYTFRTPFFAEVMGALGSMAEQCDYNIMLFTAGRERLDKQVSHIRGMASSMVDGFLIFDVLGNEPLVRELHKARVPYVCLGRPAVDYPFRYVATDHESSAFRAAAYLLGKGHRRIARIHGEEGGHVSQWREQGIRRAFEAEQTEIHNALVAFVDQTADARASYEKTLTLLDSPEKPTAFLVLGQYLGGFMRAVREKHMRIPEDISLVVLEYAASMDDSGTNLTRVPSRASDVAVLAFRKLLRMVYHREGIFEPETLQCELIEGTSCASIHNDKGESV